MSFPNDYTKYQIVTIDADQVSATLSDFTVFIDLSIFDKTGADIFDTCRTDGGDIRVTLSDGTTQLAREIVSIDTSAKTGEMHVKIPSLSSVTDTILRVWYNGSDIEPAEDSTYGKENAWASDYKMVQHMNEDPDDTSPAFKDSTINNNDGTDNGAMTTTNLLDAKIYGGIDFDGYNDYIKVPHNSTLEPEEMTVSLWLKSDTWDSPNWTGIITKRDPGSTGPWSLHVIQNGDANSGKIQFAQYRTTTDTSVLVPDVLDTSQYHYVVATVGSDKVSNIYLDGVLQSSGDAGVGNLVSNSSRSVRIGTNRLDVSIQKEYFDGIIDEVRISNTAKSSDWIVTEYANQNSPSTFYIVSDEQGNAIIYGDVVDGVSMSDAVGKRAIFSAMAQENMSLVDMDQNLGNFIAALVDQIEISAATERTAILNVSSNDSFSFSDAVSSIQKILAIVSDDVNISETLSVRADMAAIAKDAIEFSESFVATLKATAVINEIINLLDTVSTDALSIITALAADVLNVSDGSLARADFVSAVLENIELSEATINFLAALATTSETININDSAFWHGIQSAFVADGVSITSTAISIMTALATTAESISLDDSGTVKATFNVDINSALQFAETISAIATLRGSISDGINITATPLEISTLPNGKLSVSFSLKTPGVEFDIKTATIVFNLK